jgi:predicted site-specific integrase-resolvase
MILGMDDELVIPESERRYPPRAIADAWGVSWRTVHRWIHDGLPADNVGSSQRPDYRIRLADVSAFLWDRQHRRRPGAEVVSSDHE